jgi:hypothetical protein
MLAGCDIHWKDLPVWLLEVYTLSCATEVLLSLQKYRQERDYSVDRITKSRDLVDVIVQTLPLFVQGVDDDQQSEYNVSDNGEDIPF